MKIRKFTFTLLSFFLISCGQTSSTTDYSSYSEDINNESESSFDESSLSIEDSSFSQDQEEISMNVKISFNETTLYATFEDNVTSRALLERMPFTISMSNLYSREMCYRYGANTFETDNLRSDHYEIGDIAYWPPRGSLVILYEQNGEQFERQHIGHIETGVEAFVDVGTIDVTFEQI